MAKDTAFPKAFLCFLLIPLTSAIVPCANTQTEAVYHGRNHWTLPDPFLTYNNTDLSSCSVFCRRDALCKSFAFAEETCRLYSIQVADNKRRLVRDKTSVHFDSLPIPNRAPEQSHVGTCSTGNLCQNGAICVNDCTDRGYSCVCAKGFRGINCEHGVMDKLSLQATILVDHPGRISTFQSNGNIYIVVPRLSGSNGILMFKYDVETATSEEMQYIAESSIWRSTVFTMGDDVYVSIGKDVTSTDAPVNTYHFNPETEQLEETFSKPCGKGTASFLVDSRGDASWFIARYMNPDRLTNSEIYSFTRTNLGAQYSQLIETTGVDTSHMFEMDGNNFLVIANTKNNAGTLARAEIWRQPHDYGRPKTASVFAIFIRTEGANAWTLVFKAVSGVNNIDLYTLWSTAGSRNEGKQEAMKLDDTFRDHYKSSLVDTWENVVKVKVAFYDDAKSKFSLIFNAEGATNLEWFTESRLLSYPWTDVRSKTPSEFEMSVSGRYWVIADVWSTCDADMIWMMVTAHEVCSYEQTEPRPMFMYSDRKTSMPFHTDALIDCYLDNGSERALSSYVLTSPRVTAWDCLDLCRGLDYIYAGVDILNTACYCGDSGYSTGGVTDCEGRTASDATLMMKTGAKWVLHQDLDETNIPRCIDSFKGNDGNYYVIIQNAVGSTELPRYTLVYQWSKTTQLFEIHQKILSQYQYLSFKLLEVYKQTYMILAAYTDDESNGDDNYVESDFWRLEGAFFVRHFKVIQCRTCGWGSFVVDNQLYVIEGNYYGPPCTGSNADGNLKIYKWN